MLHQLVRLVKYYVNLVAQMREQCINYFIMQISNQMENMFIHHEKDLKEILNLL